MLFSCRDIHPYEPYVPIAEYGCSGRVVSANGNPIESVAVSLTYTLQQQYDTTQIDTVRITVNNRAQYYSVDVFNLRGVHIRNLYNGYPQLGTFPRQVWNKRDDNQRLVPSGKYFIRYTRDTVILKIVPYLVDGLITAWTDWDGNFSISQENLPIGELFDQFHPNGSFLGVYRVTPEVSIELSQTSLRKTYTVTLQLNNVYHGVFILQ